MGVFFDFPSTETKNMGSSEYIDTVFLMPLQRGLVWI